MNTHAFVHERARAQILDIVASPLPVNERYAARSCCSCSYVGGAAEPRHHPIDSPPPQISYSPEWFLSTPSIGHFWPHTSLQALELYAVLVEDCDVLLGLDAEGDASPRADRDLVKMQAVTAIAVRKLLTLCV